MYWLVAVALRPTSRLTSALGGFGFRTGMAVAGHGAKMGRGLRERDLGERVAGHRRVLADGQEDDLQVLGDVGDGADRAAEQGVLRADGAEALGVDDLVDLLGVLLVDVLAVLLVDAHHGPAAVVLGDHTRREVRVQVGGQRPERVGRFEVGLLEDVLAGAVALEHLEVVGTGAFDAVHVTLDEDDLVSLLPEHPCRPQADSPCTNDNESHEQGYDRGR